MSDNPYTAEIKPGDLITFTDEVSALLDEIGVQHDLEFGDDLMVLGRDHSRRFPVLVSDPRNLTWQAWIFLTIAERARDFWLKSKELEPEGEGVVSLVPIEYWNARYREKSHGERSQIWKKVQDGDVDLLWDILTNATDEQSQWI